MKRRSLFSFIFLCVLLGSGPVAGAAPPPIPVASGPAQTAPDHGLPDAGRDATTIPPDVPSDWWSAVQEDIRRSEYHVTWQETTPLNDLAAAYHAPNRAQNLRTYFAPEGPRIIPRVWSEGQTTPPWLFGLALAGYGPAGAVQLPTGAALAPEDNRLTYRRGVLTEWYVNDEEGLTQGFILAASSSASSCQFDLALSTSLTPHLRDTAAIEFTTASGETVLRYGDFSATDAAGEEVPIQLELVPAADTEATGLLAHYTVRIAFNRVSSPLTVHARITSPAAQAEPEDLSPTPDWTGEGDQATAHFGWSVGPAGDVNGDGYSDVIVGAPHYDNGYNDGGQAYVYHGSALGLSPTPAWTAAGDQDFAYLGYAVGVAGDVNGDGFSDVIVGAWAYSNGQAHEGRAYVFHGSGLGLGVVPDWTAEGGQDEAHFGYAVGTAGDVNGDGYADVVVGARLYGNGQQEEGGAFVYHGSVGGLSASANWTAESNQAFAHFGYAVDTAGDVNGDGYGDVIVGIPDYDNGENNEGRAYVYHGSAAGLGPANSWIVEGNQAGANLGLAVGTAGDVNGDGYADVIVGAYHYSNGQDYEGRAYVYHGTGGGLSTNPGWTGEGNQVGANYGYAVGTAGDVNGDGYSDVIVGARMYDNGETDEGRAYVYQGAASGLSTSPDWMAEGNQADAEFGWAVGTAGDVDSDGHSDVIVGAPYYDNGENDEGRALVYRGAGSGLSDSADWTAEGDQIGVCFAWSVGTAGDVNGDGYSDVIVGAKWYDNGQAYEGTAYVYHGSLAGLSLTPDWTAEGDQVQAEFGYAVGTAGDVNGDGYSDVIVGAKWYHNGEDGEGRAFVFHGSAGGLSPTPAWTAEGDQALAHFGYAVGTAGDVNGDGYADVIVGFTEPDYSNYDWGWLRVFLYQGSATGLSTSPDWTVLYDQTLLYMEKVYSLVNTAGDVNGDGYSDVIVGVNGYDNGETDEGRAYVYHGSPSGLGATPDWTAEGDQDHAVFGTAVGTAGDVNGDGYADVVVGAPGYDNGETDEGRAYVYHGSPVGLSATPAWSAESDQSIAFFGISVRTAGDVNSDGYADVIVGAHYYDNGETDEGQAFVFHGSAWGLSPTPDWTAEGDQVWAFFGRSVDTAGDVNGDGYSDVIVGAYIYDNGETDEGQVFVYHGNGANTLPMLPRQLRSDGSPMALWGMSDSSNEIQLALIGRMPLGREPVKLNWQVAPLGTLLPTQIISGTSDWIDALPGGVVITHTVGGLAPNTAYHWRVRLLYRPGNRLGQTSSRWFSMPGNGWNETDFRTPEMIAGLQAFNDSPTPQNWPVLLSATVSAGNPVDYNWDFGDGEGGHGQVVPHIYPAVGVYTAVVTASNSLGSLTATTVVTITAPVYRVYLPLVLRGYP